MSERSVADRILIEELIAAYSFAWDGADEVGFADLWLEQAECRFYINGSKEPATILKGKRAFRDAVLSRAAYFKKIGLVTKHFMPNTIVRWMDPDTAEVRTQAMITWQLLGTDLLPRPVQAGYYDSKVVRTPEGWKFISREVYLNGVFTVKGV